MGCSCPTPASKPAETSTMSGAKSLQWWSWLSTVNTKVILMTMMFMMFMMIVTILMMNMTMIMRICLPGNGQDNCAKRSQVFCVTHWRFQSSWVITFIIIIQAMFMLVLRLVMFPAPLIQVSWGTWLCRDKPTLDPSSFFTWPSAPSTSSLPSPLNVYLTKQCWCWCRDQHWLHTRCCRRSRGRSSRCRAGVSWTSSSSTSSSCCFLGLMMIL